MNKDNIEIQEFVAFLKSNGKLPATIEAYQRDAVDFLSYTENFRIANNTLSPQILENFQDFLRFDLGERENSIRRKIIGVRQFFKFLQIKGKSPNSIMDESIIPKRYDTRPRALVDKDVQRLIAASDKSASQLKSLRDKALLGLLAFEGLKASEIIELKWHYYLPAKKSGQASFQVAGTRKRSIILCNYTQDAMNRYKNEMKDFGLIQFIEGNQFVFIGFKGRKALTPHPKMTRHGLKFMLYELGEQSGFKKLNTEDLRHYAIRYQSKSGKNPEQIMQHLGLKRLGNIPKNLKSLEENC